MRRLASIVSLVVVALVAADRVYAEGPPPPRTVGIGRKGNQLLVSVGLQDLFGPRDTERLLSGFSTRVLIRVALVREGAPEPVATATRLAEVVYDLWDEKLRVRISTGRSPIAQTVVVPTAKAAVDAATSLDGFVVSSMDALDSTGSYHLTLRADLNPVSEELVTNVRRWLSHPSGHSRAGSTDSFFGSFVSVFVNPRIDESERMLQVTSQSFLIPKGAP